MSPTHPKALSQASSQLFRRHCERAPAGGDDPAFLQVVFERDAEERVESVPMTEELVGGRWRTVGRQFEGEDEQGLEVGAGAV